MSLDSLLPALDAPTYHLFRTACGLLLLGHLLLCWPHRRRFFLSERWGGYGQSGRLVDWVQNPVVMPLVLLAWAAAAVALVVGWQTLAAAAVNLLLCRYFFLRMRWRGILRGMGAPGFLTGWLAFAVFVLEAARLGGPRLQGLGLLVLQADFALIMLLAGVYKLNAGYFHNEGMELGLVNPQWGHWWRLYRRLRPSHWLFRFNNHMAWVGEIAAGLLMLVPATRFWGAAFIFASFVYIGLNIRLTLLCPMVMLVCVLFCGPDSPAAPLLAPLAAVCPASVPPWEFGPGVAAALAVLLVTYLASLPLVYGGMCWNFYRKTRLPGRLQGLLDGYANFFGFILWRVFSADLTHFFVLVYSQDAAGGRRPLARWGAGLRYSHVAEAITVTCLFTTLKYFPGQPALFRERLLRYARTVSHADGETLVFEVVNVEKGEQAFLFRPVAEFAADVRRGTVVERLLDDRVDLTRPHKGSPVREAAHPGTYLPVGS